MTLADIKRAVQPGAEYDVTNHYVTRTDHPCYGKLRRTVVKVTSNALHLTVPGRDGKTSTVDWPKAGQAQMDSDGTIRFYGGGRGQKPDELFLTLAPVTDAPDGSTEEPCQECSAPAGQPCEIWCIADQGTAR